MARINLLPWREELRQEKKKEFLTQLAGVCILTALLVYAWIGSVDGAISSQKQRNNILQSEINLLSKQVAEIQDLKKQRQELIDRMRVIQDLEGKRSIIVHYLDEFARAVPDGIFITKVAREGDQLSIEGISESNNRISTFMRQLDDSDWFASPNLKSVTSAPESGEQAGSFSMELKAVLPDDQVETSDG